MTKELEKRIAEELDQRGLQPTTDQDVPRLAGITLWFATEVLKRPAGERSAYYAEVRARHRDMALMAGMERQRAELLALSMEDWAREYVASIEAGGGGAGGTA